MITLKIMRKQNETNESSAISLIQRVIKTTKEADKWEKRFVSEKSKVN